MKLILSGNMDGIKPGYSSKKPPFDGSNVIKSIIER